MSPLLLQCEGCWDWVPSLDDRRLCEECAKYEDSGDEEWLFKNMESGQPDEDYFELTRIHVAYGLPTDRFGATYLSSGAELDPRRKTTGVDLYAVRSSALARAADSRPPTGVVILRRRMWRLGRRGHVSEWVHPAAGPIVSLLDVVPTQRTEIDALLNLVTPAKHPGRPPGSGTFRDAEDYEDTILPVIGMLKAGGQRSTLERTAELLALQRSDLSNVSARQLQTWTKKLLGLSWSELVERA